MKKCTYKDCIQDAVWTSEANVPAGYVNHCIDHLNAGLSYDPIEEKGVDELQDVRRGEMWGWSIQEGENKKAVKFCEQLIAVS